MLSPDGPGSRRRGRPPGRSAPIRNAGTPPRCTACTSFGPPAGSSPRPVALDRLKVQVRLQPVQAALAPEPALLVPAERRAGIEPVERVRPDHPGPQPLGHP